MIKVGHSDKVILYKGTRNLRYFVELKDNLDLEKLKKAVNDTLPNFDFFKRKVVNVNNVFCYEGNNEPVVFLPLDNKQIYLGSDDSNKHLFVIRYTEKSFVLSMFHSISDFYGSWQFLRSVIYNYSLLIGKNVSKFEPAYGDLSKMDELEYSDPYLKFANKDAKRTYEYKDGNNIYYIPKDICNPSNIRRSDISISTSKLLELKDKWNTSFAPAVSYLLVESVRNAFEVKDQVIVSKFPLDMRKHVGTNTPVNFSDAMYLSLTCDEIDSGAELSCKKFKEDILAQTTKENCELLMYSGIENADKFEGSVVEKTLNLNMPKNTFTITYPGNLSLPEEYDDVVKEIHLDSLSGSDCLRIVIYTYNDKLTFSVLQNLVDNRYCESLIKTLKEYGFNPTFEEKGTIYGDLFDDKKIEQIKTENRCGKYLYYVEQRRKLHCTLIFDIDHDVDGDVLQKALDNTLTVYQLVNKSLVLENDNVYFVDNDAPAKVINFDGGFIPGSDKLNKHQFYVTYWNNRIRICVSHGITDGGGLFEFSKTLIYEYFRIKFGREYDAPLIRKVSEGSYPDDQVDFFDKVDLNAKEVKADGYQIETYPVPESQKRGEYKVCYLTIKSDDFIKCTKYANTSVACEAFAFMACAIYRVHKESQQYPILARITADVRNIFGIPHSQLNCSLGAHLSVNFNDLIGEKLLPTLANLKVKMKSQLVPEILNYDASVYVKTGRYKAELHPSISISNMGNLNLGELNSHIKDFTILEGEFHKINFFSYNGVFKFAFHFGEGSRVYAQKVQQIFKELGFDSEVSELITLEPENE